MALTDGQYSGDVDTLTAGAVVTVGKLGVTYAATTTTLGVKHSVATSDVPGNCIILQSGNTSDSVLVLMFGKFAHSTAFSAFTTPGADLWRDPATDGVITTTKPTTSTNKLQRVGSVADSTVIHFTPGYSVFTVT